jgi:cytochrome c peroxidase
LKRLLISVLLPVFLAGFASAQTASNVVLQPLPAPAQTTNVVPLSPGEQLGKDIFFDSALSNPEGYACATCHLPQSGFTGSSSFVNLVAGPAPGVIPGRAGRRKPQSIPYVMFSPAGPYRTPGEGGTYIGGDFWDGRAPDTTAQARMPFLDQNEMANTPIGPYPPHAGGYSPAVAVKLASRPYTPLFEAVFGSNVFSSASDQDIYSSMTAAIAMYEASAEVNQFSSKFDASTNGVPALTNYTFTASEEAGRELFFGAAQCFQCHSDAGLPDVYLAAQGKETFTMYCYANIGVPANPANPFYQQTNCDSDPEGCNPLGSGFVDYGLGANPNPAPDGTVFMNSEPGDIAPFRGLFKAPSLRNVDLRPDPSFVKSYMHNGVFKSLEEVVHFYNKRNIATNAAGDELAFDSGRGPPAGYAAIFPPPEVMDNLQNSSGNTPDQAASLPPPSNPTLFIPLNGQVGNLQLTAAQETNLVCFLKTLTDGYTSPNPITVPSSLALFPPSSNGAIAVMLTGKPGAAYILQSSTDLKNWTPLSTNILTTTSLFVTNSLSVGQTQQFWRAIGPQ